MKVRENYNQTLNACYLGYITQAIVNNFAPLLFLTFHKNYGISLDKIAMLVSFNFGVQLIVDLLAAKFVDRIGYRICVVAAHIFAAAGLIGMGVFPEMLVNPYHGLLLAIIFYAIGGGLIEVLVSPIVEACPTERKEAAMGLLHSFYCWGHVFVVLASTLYFSTVGIQHWKYLAFLWSVIPLFNAVFFSQVPIRVLVDENEGLSIRQLSRQGIFWVLVLLMVCAGASEQGMSQWASAFAEAGLKVSKTVGDLMGPCMFAVLMGISRVFYSKISHRIDLKKYMVGCSLLCVCSYLLASLSSNAMLSLVGCALCGFSVGVMWPGSFSLAAQSCPRGGTAMFALLALAGDLGCSSGPAVVGAVTERLNDNLKLGVLAAAVFPVCMIIGVQLLKKVKRESYDTCN
ncbi:MAG: MFS transporter [Eubacteriales bacterium]|nr:MFS transporter [Eubacteriales bacterium]